MQEKQQLMNDARTIERLAASPANRQEAIVLFILSCMQASVDLKQMCNARRCLSHPVDSLEQTAEVYEKRIAKEFRNVFGHALFIETDEEIVLSHIPAPPTGVTDSMAFMYELNQAIVNAGAEEIDLGETQHD